MVSLIVSINSRAIDLEFNAQLNPFSTDYCSGSPDYIPFLGVFFSSLDFRSCCLQHDMNYWMGGEEKVKNITDDVFAQCLSKKVMPGLSNAVSPFYANTVRYTGSPEYNISLMSFSFSLKTSWRWGYGWNVENGNVGYKELPGKAYTNILHELIGSDIISENDVKEILENRSCNSYLKLFKCDFSEENTYFPKGACLIKNRLKISPYSECAIKMASKGLYQSIRTEVFSRSFFENLILNKFNK